MQRSTVALLLMGCLFYTGLLFFPSSAAAQSQFTDCVAPTSQTATIIVPASVEPSLDGQPLPEGTEIAAFTPEGVCAGVGVWDGNSLGITIYGNDPLPNGTDLPGFADGDPFNFHVWPPDHESPVNGERIGAAFDDSESYLMPEGAFNTNGIYKLGLFAVTSPPPPVAEDCSPPEVTETIEGPEIALEIRDPEGIHHVAFVNPDNKPFIDNLTVTTDEPRLTTTDSIWWGVVDETDPDDENLVVPLTSASFTLTQADPSNPEVAYFARITNQCGAVLDLDPIHSLRSAPEAVALKAPYPNPASDLIHIDLELPDDTDLRVRVFDVLGRHVAILWDGPELAGRHTITWQPDAHLSAGVYLIQLSTAGITRTQKVTLVR